MDFKKASLFLSFLFFLHLQHHFAYSISRSTLHLASIDPNHDNLPVHAVQSKPNADVIAGNLTELVVVKKGGGGGRSFGGGGRSFGGGGRGGGGGGGRSFGGGGRGGGGRNFGAGGSRGGRGGIHPIPIYGGSNHGVHRSNGGWETAGGGLGLSILVDLILVLWGVS